ncbi:hypothetical protein TrVFT333_002197 [Trichoderma virens FT-333]|nr:hypothetical protein TrVFT333_002197 [Trichoderma virens FT-333]
MPDSQLNADRSSDVNELEQRPAKKSSRQLTATLKELFEQQKEIKAAVTELLLAKLPKDNKYARLSSELKSYNEAAHATGFINEEGELGNHTRKRRRLLIPQQTITNGEPNMVNFNAQQSMVEGAVPQRIRLWQNLLRHCILQTRPLLLMTFLTTY